MTDESMNPMLRDGDVALVSKLRYGLRIPGAGAMVTEWSSPKVGDLVVAVSVGDPPISVLRRITAGPGEKALDPEGKEITLKDEEFFLSAEQKEGIDSRKLGPVPRKAIIGKATHVWLAKRPSSEGNSQVESPKSDWRILQPL